MNINNSLMQKNYLNISYIKSNSKQDKNINKNDDDNKNNSNILVLSNNRFRDIIENLKKQKQGINDLREEYLKIAKENGFSDDEIDAQLSEYEEQLNSIDRKIEEVYANERKQELEKVKQEKKLREEKQSKLKENKVKDEEDIQKQQIKNAVEITLSLDGIRKSNVLKAHLERRETYLSIELDKDISRMGNHNIVKKKQEELLNLQEGIKNLEFKNSEEINKINNKYINNNNKEKINIENNKEEENDIRNKYRKIDLEV